MIGLWTWSRGGGWEGPYPKNELWCEMNAWILAQWAISPTESEETLFRRYTKEKLGMAEPDAKKLREIALLSEHATLRGFRSVSYPDSVPSMWVRDEYITFPVTPQNKSVTLSIIADKDDAVKDWDRIVELTKGLKVKDELTSEYVKVTCEYGRQMYRIFRSLYHLAGIKKGFLNQNKSSYFAEYDDAWKQLEQLQLKYPRTCPSLYSKTIIRRTYPAYLENADKVVNSIR